ncbi:Protein-glutamate methylesterase/protein-glutamine glutaminase [Streptomyces fumanus]
MTIRVMLVDDQVLLRTGFRMVLAAQSDMEVVAEAGDGVEALEVLRSTAVDVVLILVQRDRRGDRGQRLRQALAAQQLRLVPGVRRELVAQPGPGVREERLVAVVQEPAQPGADARRVGQQPLGEPQLARAPRGGQVQGAAARPGVRQRRRPGCAVRQGAGELQGRVDELLVRQLVQQVQVLGEGGAGQRGAAGDAGERHEQVRERRPPRKSASLIRSARCESRRAVTPVTQPWRPGWWPGSDSACSAMHSSARGEGADGDPLRPQPRDVDAYAHALMVHPATDNAVPIDVRRQSARRGHRVAGRLERQPITSTTRAVRPERPIPMSVTQQYLLDTYRAHQLGTPPPPPPGTHDLRVLRAGRDERRFRAVIAGRPARGRLRHALEHRPAARPGPGVAGPGALHGLTPRSTG